MAARLFRLFVAAPLVVLLGAAMALAAAPEGDVTARDREVVARLTRSGVQRFDADGSHAALDVLDAAAGTPSPTPAAEPGMPAAGSSLRPRPDLFTMLDIPAVRPRTGRPSASPARGRAPPRR